MRLPFDPVTAAAVFTLPNSGGDFDPAFQAYLRELGQKRPSVLLFFAPKAAGTYLRAAAIDAAGGQLMRIVHAFGGREPSPYMPTFIRYFQADPSEPVMVSHAHMQGFPVNLHFIEALDLKPVIMLRSVPDMLVSYLEMLNSELVTPELWLNSMIPARFRELDFDAQADFIVDMLAPWYASYFATWLDYVRKEPSRVCVLRYPDFVRDPVAALETLLRHSSSSSPVRVARRRSNRPGRNAPTGASTKANMAGARIVFATATWSVWSRCYSGTTIWSPTGPISYLRRHECLNGRIRRASERPHPSRASLSDYIMVTDNVLPASDCERLIERFEATEAHQICRRDGGHSFSQIEITTAWPDEHAKLLPIFLLQFQRYQQATQAHYWPANIAFEHLRVKRYMPDGQDFFSRHVDVADQHTARRFITGFIYLNAPAGGETVFPDLDLSISPETGKLLVFPPLWLFPHEGRPPRLRPKYILHTYLCYGS